MILIFDYYVLFVGRFARRQVGVVLITSILRHGIIRDELRVLVFSPRYLVYAANGFSVTMVAGGEWWFFHRSFVTGQEIVNPIVTIQYLYDMGVPLYQIVALFRCLVRRFRNTKGGNTTYFLQMRGLVFVSFFHLNVVTSMCSFRILVHSTRRRVRRGVGALDRVFDKLVR